MKNVIIAILVALLIVAGFMIAAKKKANIAYEPWPETEPANPTTPKPRPVTTTPAPTTNTPVANPNLITKSAWSISLVKPSGWDITSNTTNEVILTQDTGEYAGDIMTVSYISGNSITDTDNKFGNITYYYNGNNQSWMVELPDEQNGGMEAATVATPISYTADGLPVFNGTRRWKTYIVPLSHTTFVKLNITGGGFIQPLTDLLATLKKI